MNLLRTILSSVWMIDEATLRAATPSVLKLMNGENVNFYNKELDMSSFAVTGKVKSNLTRYRNYNDAPPGSVAIHRVMGTITKHDQYCGPDGTESLMNKMARADRHENISAHLFEMESGGGEATNIETVARFIKNDIKKPVITWFNGVSASAAYYIAAATDEIYASEETDMVGSIGTLITFADFKGYFKKLGIDMHEVYADQSTLKNLDFKKALEGDYKMIKEGLLNPYAQRFIDTVQEFRNITDADAFKGKIFMANKAIEIGMIDGLKTFAQAVERASQLGKSNSTLNITNMSHKRINAALGYDLEIHNGGAFLRVDELDKIDKKISAEGTEVIETSQLEALTNSIKAVNTSVGGIQTAVAELTKKVDGNTDKLDAQEKEIKVIGDAPGGAATVVATTKDPAATVVNPEQVAYEAEVKANAEAADKWDNPFKGV